MKKLTLNKTWLLLTSLLSLGISSCLKDKGFDNGEYGAINSNVEGKEYVSIPLAAKAVNQLSLEVKTGVQNVGLFKVSYDYKDPAASDIAVTIAVNNTLITDVTLTPLPASTYTIPANIKILSGLRLSSDFQLSINTSTLDPNKIYAIGFTIMSVDKASVIIPSNMKNVLFTFGVKNKYDGIYTMTGTLQDLAVTTISAKSPQTVHLITTGASSAKLYNAGTATASFKEIFPIVSAGSESAYGTFMPEFIFDANNNVTSVVNTYGQPAANTRSAAVDPSGANKWDPTTKTLKVKFFMYQPSAIAGIRGYFDYTLTYVGPR